VARRWRIWVMVASLVVVIGYLASPYWKQFVGSSEDKERFAGDSRLLDKLSQAHLEGNTAPTPVADEDWPQWRGPNRDGIAQGKGLLTRWPAGGPRQLWKTPGGPGHSSLAVVGGRVYTMVQDGADEVVVCLNSADGAVNWRQRYPAMFHETYAGTGPHATPTVADGAVYTVGATGMFHCLDAQTGDVRWHHDLPQEFQTPNQEYGTSFSPLVQGDLVFAIPGGSAGGSIAAFDRHTGRLVWKGLDDRGGYSSPVAATIAGKRQIVFLTGESVMGVAPESGKVYWRYPWTTHAFCNIATPIVVGSYVFVSSGYGKGCVLLEISSDEAGELKPLPVYEHNRMRNHFSTCVLHRDHLYGFDDAFLVCMELRSGKVRWKQRGFQKGSVLVAGEYLLVLGENGRLALAEPSPEAFREKAACTISESRCWALPVLVQGRLYVRDQENIRCLDLRQQD
jgi:outer membrane protein assembly factor BamB